MNHRLVLGVDVVVARRLSKQHQENFASGPPAREVLPHLGADMNELGRPGRLRAAGWYLVVRARSLSRLTVAGRHRCTAEACMFRTPAIRAPSRAGEPRSGAAALSSPSRVNGGPTAPVAEPCRAIPLPAGPPDTRSIPQILIDAAASRSDRRRPTESTDGQRLASGAPYSGVSGGNCSRPSSEDRTLKRRPHWQTRDSSKRPPQLHIQPTCRAGFPTTMA